MVVAASAAIIFICTEAAGVSEESGARGVLLLGLLPITALAGLLMGTARISSKCTQQLQALEEGSTVRTNQVYPKGLPKSSAHFTSLVFTFGAPDSLFGPERIGSSSVAASESLAWMDAQELSSGAVTLPYIDHVCMPSDVELATRTLIEYLTRVGRDPPQAMLQHAAGIYSKGLLRYMNNPLVKLHYAWFLFILSGRPQVAHNFLERNESVVGCLEMEASPNLKYNAYKLTDRLRRKLNIRERHHEECGRNAQKMHETVLHQMHQFWLRLMELSVDMQQVGSLATSISENRDKGLLQFQRALSDDLQMLNMFADFLEEVMLDKDAAQACREEIREMEQEKKQRQMGGSARLRVSTSDGSAFVQKMLESLSNRKDSFGSAANSTIRKLSLNMNLVFMVLILLVVGNVVFEIFQSQTQLSIVDKMDSAGQVRMLSQKAAYEVYDLFHTVEAGQQNLTQGQVFNETAVEEQRTFLKQTATRFSTSHNHLTHGSRLTAYAPHVVYYKQPLTEVNTYPYGLNSRQSRVVSLWSLGNMITNALHTIDVNLTTTKLRESVDASQASTQLVDQSGTAGAAERTLNGLQQDSSVLFITENTPHRIAVAFNRSMEFYKDENEYQLRQAMYTLVGLFTSSAIVIIMVYLLFLWYFKRITVSKMITLQLFTLIPFDTLERLSTDAKGRLDVVRKALRKGPQSGRAAELEEAEDEDTPDVQIPQALLEELRHKKPGDEVQELTEAQLPFLEALLAARVAKELAGDDTAALSDWITHIQDNQTEARRGAAGVSSPSAAPVPGHSTVDPVLAFIQKNILNAPVPPGILRDRAAMKRPGEDKRKVDFKSVRSDDRRKTEADERRRKRAELIAAKADESDASRDQHSDSDEEDESRRKKKEKQTKKKRRAADESIPASFWLINVAIIILVGVGLGLTLSVFFEATKFHEPFEERTQMVETIYEMDQLVRQMVQDARTYVQFGDLRLYVRFWDTVHSRRLLKLEDRLVTLGASEEEMSLLSQSRVRAEKVEHSLTAGTVLAKSAFGDPSAAGSGLFKDIADFTWTVPDTEILRTQASHDVIARYLEPAAPVGVFRPPPGGPHLPSADALGLSKDKQAELARSFCYSDVLNDDVEFVLKSMHRIIELLDNRTASSLTDTPDSIDTLLIVIMALFYCALVGCACNLRNMSCQPSLTQYGTLRIVYVASGALLVVAGALPLGFREKVDTVEEGLFGRREVSDTAWQSMHRIAEYSRNAESYVQFGVETNVEAYFKVMENDTFSLNRLYEEMRRGGMRSKQLVTPPLGPLKTLFSQLTPIWNRLRHLELTAIALTALRTESENEQLSSFVQGWKWNASMEKTYLEEVHAYPACKTAYQSCIMYPYTSWLEDGRKSSAEEHLIARSTVMSRRNWDLTREQNQAIQAQLDDLKKLADEELGDRKDDLNANAVTLLSVVSTVSFITLLMVSGVIAYVLIQLAENNQQQKNKLDNPLFRTLLLRCRLSLGTVGVLTVVIFVVSMVSVASTKDFAEDLDLASAREMLVAKSMVYANRLVNGVQRQRAEALVGIKGCVRQINTYRTKLYFGEDLDSGGYNEVGKSQEQDQYLFGNDATDDTVYKTYYHSKCANSPNAPSFTAGTYPRFSQANNPLPMPLDMGLRRWVSTLEELVERCEDTPPADEAKCQALLTELRGVQVNPLITALEHSGDLYEKRASDSIKTYSLAAKCVFVVTLLTILVLYVRVFRRMVSSLTEEERGTKSMLKMIPQDVRESVPAISEYLETGKVDNTDQLQKNFEQSQKLLANILPAKISHRLKSGENPIADFHHNITICFTDFCGFTSIASKLNAVEIVTFLNEVFIEFDLIVEMLELEKIKTIGDAYFLAGGLDPNITDHSLRCVEAALQMFKALDEHNQKHPDRPQLKMRLGCHSGPAVAGCIGVKKVAYDLWGDTVALAETCESGGVPDHVHLSPHTKSSIEEYFIFQPRGDSGGKVAFPSFLIVGRKRPTPYMHVIRQAEGRRRDAIANGRW
eukprot:TRINITY_DN15433_c0_g1_i1.p1 TRINITY_DN15433_c0_g1~~TRINITY_DN15433_c0_g1_i1.p1  ORF type:complete len:2330 (+),score=588.57 TRINITY_DN15433_c0_g1_i1:977-6991(+)